MRDFGCRTSLLKTKHFNKDAVLPDSPCMFHKIKNNNIVINVADYISKSTRSLRGEHQHAYVIPQNKVEAYQFSFFTCNQMLEPASDIPDRSAIPGNFPKSYVESNSQWGNKSVSPQRIASQTQTGQL